MNSVEQKRSSVFAPRIPRQKILFASFFFCFSREKRLTTAAICGGQSQPPEESPLSHRHDSHGVPAVRISFSHPPTLSWPHRMEVTISELHLTSGVVLDHSMAVLAGVGPTPLNWGFEFGSHDPGGVSRLTCKSRVVSAPRLFLFRGDPG